MIVDRASDALDAPFRLMLLMLLNDSTLFWMVPPELKVLMKFSDSPTSIVMPVTSPSVLVETLFTSKSPHHAPSEFWSEMVSPCERLAEVVIVTGSVLVVPAVAFVNAPALSHLLEV